MPLLRPGCYCGTKHPVCCSWVGFSASCTLNNMYEWDNTVYAPREWDKHAFSCSWREKLPSPVRHPALVPHCSRPYSPSPFHDPKSQNNNKRGVYLPVWKTSERGRKQTNRLRGWECIVMGPVNPGGLLLKCALRHYLRLSLSSYPRSLLPAAVLLSVSCLPLSLS